ADSRQEANREGRSEGQRGRYPEDGAARARRVLQADLQGGRRGPRRRVRGQPHLQGALRPLPVLHPRALAARALQRHEPRNRHDRLSRRRALGTGRKAHRTATHPAHQEPGRERVHVRGDHLHRARPLGRLRGVPLHHGGYERDVRGRGGPAGLEDVRYLDLYLARGRRSDADGLRYRHLRGVRRRRYSGVYWARGRLYDRLDHRAVAHSRVHRAVHVRDHLLFRAGGQAEVPLDQPRRLPRVRFLVAVLAPLLVLRRRVGLFRHVRLAGGRHHPDALHLLHVFHNAARGGDEPGDRMAHPGRQGRGREDPGGGPQTGRPPTRPRQERGGGRL
ncbi:MAG: Ribonuclease BN, partial [uncultured Rubrobacteraceae bacterium]